MRGPRFGQCGRHRRLLGSAVTLAAITLLAQAAPAGASGDTLALSFSPAHPSGTTPVTITASGSTSAAHELVIVAVAPAATGCPSDYQNAPGGFWIDQDVPNPGSFNNVQSIPRHVEHGSYDICGWLVQQTSPATVVATATPVPMTVSNPDSLTLSAGPAAITDGGSTTVSVKGVADVQNPEVFVTEKPSIDGGCAASPALDHGTPIADYDPAFVNYGTFTDSATEYPGVGKSGPDALPPGVYRLCAWLIDAGGSTSAPLAPAASATVTLVPPTGTLAFSLPELVRAGSRFTVTADQSTPAADVGLYVDVKPLPAHGRACAANHSLEPRSAQLVINDGHAPSTSVSAKLPRGGVYVACAWLEWPHGTIDGPFMGRTVALAAHQRPTVYGGGSSQGLRGADGISFELVDGQVVDLTYHARFTCSRRGHKNTHPVYATTFPALGVEDRDRFADTFLQGSDRAVVSGRIDGRHARGEFSEAYVSGGYTCRSGKVSFTARRTAAAAAAADHYATMRIPFGWTANSAASASPM
jgi:hypothetical protein